MWTVCLLYLELMRKIRRNMKILSLFCLHRSPASADEGDILLTLTWHCSDFPEDGAYSGKYVFTATLPDGYTLDSSAAALCVNVEIGSEEISLYSEGSYSVSVGGTELSADESTAAYAVTNDNGTVEKVTDGTVPTDNFVKFEVEDGTGILTLKNANIEAGNRDGIVLSAGSELVLEGVNTVKQAVISLTVPVIWKSAVRVR